MQSQKLGVQLHPLLQRRTATGWVPGPPNSASRQFSL